MWPLIPMVSTNVFLISTTNAHASCGSVYTPYDAAVAICQAALAAQAALNTLETQSPWTYNEHILEGTRTRNRRG